MPRSITWTIDTPEADVFEFEIPEAQSTDLFGFGHLMEGEEEEELQTRPAEAGWVSDCPEDPLGPLANWDDDAPIDPWG
ncbi:MAG: hypothetical protein AAGE13_08365 [Pseudomonadota bacterium]